MIMDQPDSSGDGLQPQDLSSSCALPIAFDLSKKGEDCLRKASAVEALHVVQPPGWFVGAGTSEAVTFPENACDLSPVPGEQIQPDNAFSNTTVTLSYVSRSHVFSSTPLTAHCPLYDVSSLSKKLSQHASGYEALPLMSEADGAPLCVEMDPHCLQPVATPVGVAPHESFEFVLPAQVMQNVATGVCFLKHAVDLNGIQDSGDTATAAAAVEILTPLQQGAPIVCKLSQEENGCLQNGDCTALWDTGACGGETASGDLFTTPTEVQGKRDSEVLFLISRTEQPLGVHDMGTTRNFCSSLNREYISPLEDPVSPPATPQDEIEDVFVLPQTASSPTGENFPEDLVTKHSEVGEVCSPLPVESTCTGETECLPGNSNTENISELSSQPLTDNGLDTEQAPSEQCHDLPEDKASGVMNKAESTAKQQLNGSTPAKEGRPERKILPPRSGRGIRLEAIVQNIHPSRFRASSTRSTKKSNCSKAAVAESKAINIDREVVTASNDPEMRENVCTSEQETSTSETSTCLLQTSVQREEGGDSSSCFKEGSTSDSEHTQSLSKYLIKGTSDEMTNNTSSSTPTKKSGKRPSGTSNCKSSNDRRAISPLPPPKSHKKKSQPAASPRSKSSPSAKKAHTAKKKRKKLNIGQPSMFSPKEPEIKLKYVNYKEEKRDSRADTFSPFVHVERKRYVKCTVVNYPEEVKPTVRKGQQQPTSGFVSGAVPSTPFLQYGRVSNDATRRAALVCCLCGRPANTLDLGDLHGPYYANGSKAETRPSAGVAGLKAEEEEEDLSDSDSSFGTKARKCASAVPGSWARRARQRRPLDAALGGPYQRWTSDSELSHSPAAKKSRLDGGAAESWYTPPVVPLDSNEYWLHEDCGIWSAGVFLVKGKLYGLEKAVKMAQETMCSMCHSVGATLGCFFRECPNKYHYICAVQSDCVLNEENFSMKCTKHKNKSIKGSTNRKNAR